MQIAALGLTFKAGTDDLRESPSLAIIDELRDLGATIRAYDPTAAGALDPVQRRRLAGIELAADPYAAAAGADVVVVLTEWPEFGYLDLDRLAEVMRGRAVVDTRNVLDPVAVRSQGSRTTAWAAADGARPARRRCRLHRFPPHRPPARSR